MAGLTPLMKMYTLGHTFMPPPAFTPVACATTPWRRCFASSTKRASSKPKRTHRTPCFEAATLFARTEGIIPAPESSHAILAAIDEALAAKEEGKSRTILFNLSGHGLLDLQAYDDYLAGRLVDDHYPAEKVREAMKALPEI